MCLLVDLPSAIKRQRRRSNVHIRQPLTPKEEEMCMWDAQEPVRSVLAHHTRLSFRVQFVLFDTHFCNSHSIFYHLLVSATRLSETCCYNVLVWIVSCFGFDWQDMALTPQASCFLTISPLKCKKFISVVLGIFIIMTAQSVYNVYHCNMFTSTNVFIQYMHSLYSISIVYAYSVCIALILIT